MKIGLFFGISFAGAIAFASPILTFQCPGLAQPVVLSADLTSWQVQTDVERDSHPEQEFCSIERHLFVTFADGAVSNLPLRTWTKNRGQATSLDLSRHYGEACKASDEQGDFLTLRTLEMRGRFWCLPSLDPKSPKEAPIWVAGPECLAIDANIAVDSNSQPVWSQSSIRLKTTVNDKPVYDGTCSFVSEK